MKRRHKLIRPASYYRKNPLTDIELYGGIAVGVAVLGLGGYLIYQKYGNTPANQYAAAGQFGSATAPGLTAAQLADQQAAATDTGIYAPPPAPPGGLNT